MAARSEFARKLAELDLSHAERAVAFLWFYRQNQDFEERSASELAGDLHDEDFPKPRPDRLHAALKATPDVIRGKRPKSFQINVRSLSKLDAEYGPLLKLKVTKVSDALIPQEWVAQSRRLYLERMVHQINGTYDAGYYDACLVMCRRLMEALIIETYILQKRHQEIQDQRGFFGLERLIQKITSDKAIVLSRHSPKTMSDIKELGDTAAHDRVYVARQDDLDGLIARYRRLIADLLAATGIHT